MSSPHRLLLSRISPAPCIYKPSQASCDTGFEDSFSSLSTSTTGDLLSSRVDVADGGSNRSCLKLSGPMEMPPGIKTCHSEEDSGFSAPPSPFSTLGSFLSPVSHPCTPLGTPSSNSGSGNSLKHSGSLSGLQKRFLRNVTTSLDSFAIFSGDEDEHRDCGFASSFQTKLGMTVMFTLNQEDPELQRRADEWLFLQQETIDSCFNKLHSSIEFAYLHRSTFVSSVYKAIDQFQQEIDDLVNAPRLSDPLWLSLLTADSDIAKDKLFNKLSQSLSYLLARCDTKHTNFFMSKLLTAVLTHHLGWVSTVTPEVNQDDFCSQSSISEEQNSGSKFTLNPVNCFSELQPYNALWGQLSELTGIVGNPSRLARTVVVGKNKVVLEHLLVLLSYLIRCSQVVKKSFGSVNKPFVADSPISRRQFLSSASLSSIAAVTDPSYQSQEVTHRKIRGGHLNKNKCHSWRRSADCAQCFADTSVDSKSFGKKTSQEGKWMLEGDYIDITPRVTTPDSPRKDTHGVHSTASDKSTTPKDDKALPAPDLSRTKSNLTELICQESDDDLKNESPFNLKSKPLYPNLSEMEDHRETFGSKDIQPEVIAEKVKRIVRVPPILHQKEFRHSSKKLDKNAFSKVLFTLGDGEELGLDSDSKEDLVKTQLEAAKPSGVSSSDRHRVSFPECKIKVAALPKPEDRLVERMRAQGKSSDKEHAAFKEIDSTSYPSLDELKKDLCQFSIDISAAPSSKTHKRNRSDPINGAPMVKMPPYFEALGGVTEERTDPSRSVKEPTIPIIKLQNRFSQQDLEEEVVLTPQSMQDHSFDVINSESIKIGARNSGSIELAESLLGGILDNYSSVFVLQATTQTDYWEDQLRADLLSAAQRPVLDAQINEAIAIVAHVDKWEVEVVSSHSYAVDRRGGGQGSASLSLGGIPVMMSPLVSQMADSLLHMVRIELPPHFIAHCLESQLRDLYLKSHLLSAYLLDESHTMMQCEGSESELRGHGLPNLSELSRTLDVDLNDIPLLLSVASTHTPALTQKFGLTFK